MIYAVNNMSREHRIITEGAPELDDWREMMQGWNLLKADADGWIGWMGGECPVPDYSSVEVKFSEGTDGFGLGTSYWWGTTVGGTGRITHYRPYFQPDIEQPAPQEWSGIGFPGAGIECEALILSDSIHKDWVSGVSEGMVRIPNGRFGCIFKTQTCRYLVGAQDEFRPIRTGRERWIIDACKSIESETEKYNTDIDCSIAMRMTIESIHDALASGTLPMPEKD